MLGQIILWWILSGKHQFNCLEARHKLELGSPNTRICIKKENILEERCHSEKGNNGGSAYSSLFWQCRQRHLGTQQRDGRIASAWFRSEAIGESGRSVPVAAVLLVWMPEKYEQ